MRARPLALLATALLTGCLVLEDADDDDTSPTPFPDGQIVVTTVCTDDTCGATGTLIVEMLACSGGTVLSYTSQAGITLTTSGHTSGWSPVVPGTYCVDGWLETGTDGLSTGDAYATLPPGPESITSDESIHFTLVLNSFL